MAERADVAGREREREREREFLEVSRKINILHISELKVS